LLKAHQEGELDFSEFAHRYEAEVRERESVLAELRELERIHGVVVLLCWERSPRPCHRQVLLAILSGRRAAE
jgi:uncharacterized protein YeaO (DUF488 family)